MVKVIIVQGMTCLGKSTLCRRLVKDIPKCKYFSLDEYKENIWDKHGFDSIEEKETQSILAKELFYDDIYNTIKGNNYECVLIDYVFNPKYEKELSANIRLWNVSVKTIYLKPEDLEVHKKIWEERSRNFSIRHPAHGAVHYHNGVGYEYVNRYETKIFETLPTFGETLEINISFNPYSRDISYADILNFIK